MMKRIVGVSLQRRALVVVLAAAVMGVGVLQIDQIEVDTLPEFLPPIVEVQTEALGLSAAEVEQLITVPLEADLLNGVAWLESIESESVPGLSSIVMTFEPGTQILDARQVVQERLTQAAGLPNVSRAPAMVQPLSAESRVMMIGLSSDEVSLLDMSVLARWNIRPFLMGVKGVANVSVWGQRDRQLQVLVDPAVLAENRLTLLDVVETTGNALWVSPLSYLEASTPGVGGFIDGPNQRIGIQHILAINDPDDLAAVPIEDRRNLTLGDVTTVVIDHQPLIGDAIVDEGPGLLLVVEKFPWSNTVETTRAVENAIAELAPGLTGIAIDTEIFRPATYIERSIDNIRTTAAVSLILIVIAMFALLYSWRVALVTLISLLASLIGAGIVLYATNTTINTMVLAGLVLALGFVIDDAIGNVVRISDGLTVSASDSPDAGDRATSMQIDQVPRKRIYELARELGVPSRHVVERAQPLGLAVTTASSGLDADGLARVMTSYEDGVAAPTPAELSAELDEDITQTVAGVATARREDPIDSTIVRSLLRSRGPLLFAAVVLILALVPVFLMEGAAGEFLPSVGLTMAAVLAVSALVSITLTPALSALLLGDATNTESPVLKWMKSLGDKVVLPFVRSARPALIGVVVLIAVGAALLTTLDRGYIPEFKQTDLLISLDGAPGTSLVETNRITLQMAAELQSLAGVEKVGAQVGRAVLSDEVVNVNSSKLWVRIDPDAEYGSAVNDIREVVQGYPGFGRPDAVSYSNVRVDNVLQQGTVDLVVRIYGENPAVLGALASDVADLVAAIEGTENVRPIQPLLEPAIEIEVDLERAAEYGVKPGDVRRTAATLLSGIEVGSFFEEQKVFEVVVWSPAENRTSISNVENLLVDTPRGGVVELKLIADVRVAPNQAVINRDAVSRYIDVTADVSGRSIGSVEKDISNGIEAQGLPFEYHVRILDDHADASANQREVILVTLATAVAIFLLLQAAFSSWRLGVMLFLTTPLATVGGLVALVISGGTYSIGSSIGLFAIFGITLRGTMSLVGRYESLQLDDGMRLDAELVTKGLRDQLAPTMATLVLIAAVMLPIVAFGDIAGHEVIRPMAIVVLGGLVSSAVVTLFLAPALYGAFAKPATPVESLHAT